MRRVEIWSVREASWGLPVGGSRGMGRERRWVEREAKVALGVCGGGIVKLVGRGREVRLR